MKILDEFEQFISTNYKVGRGRRKKFSGKDVLFMSLATMKHGGNWDWIGKMFGAKGPQIRANSF